MPTPLKNNEYFSWIKGDLKLAGSIDNRLINLALCEIEWVIEF